MSAARHVDHRQLPVEPPSDPINAMLDLAESAIRTIIEHGAEAQLRTRLARLLPSPSNPAASQPVTVQPATVHTTPVQPASSREWTQVLTALRAARSPAAHTAAAREIAARHLAAATAAERRAAIPKPQETTP